MSGLCLAAGALAATLATDVVTLAWTHSVEKTAWQEDYRLIGGGLVVEEARIKGSGAGMEPPAGAVLRDGWWAYRPAAPAAAALRLTHSDFAADYRLCWDGACRTLGELLPGLPGTAVVELRPCG
ncbi:MAG TPA: DUF1850 domain-containing protein [Candidatus Limnocylindrales bacterium]|jgi:hypothetical protein